MIKRFLQFFAIFTRKNWLQYKWSYLCRKIRGTRKMDFIFSNICEHLTNGLRWARFIPPGGIGLSKKRMSRSGWEGIWGGMIKNGSQPNILIGSTNLKGRNTRILQSLLQQILFLSKKNFFLIDGGVKLVLVCVTNYSNTNTIFWQLKLRARREGEEVKMRQKNRCFKKLQKLWKIGLKWQKLLEKGRKFFDIAENRLKIRKSCHIAQKKIAKFYSLPIFLKIQRFFAKWICKYRELRESTKAYLNIRHNLMI